ncbi:hypothetical protein D1007_51495 [Hordeum vulgare]|nr:hypothetical protein D1007_51495 [Hordeum vulgare]
MSSSPSTPRSELSPEMSSTHGAWEGSNINVEHIEVLYHYRKLPSVTHIAERVSESENSPSPWQGEVVVFAENFARGLGLSARRFFSGFLMHYGVQPHHLAPNIVLQLVAFITLCEGFVGIEPRLDVWCWLFFFKQSSVKDKATNKMWMTPCGVALVYHRSGSGFPELPLQD